MMLNINESALVALCGGNWGNASATNIGAIIKEYLHGSPDNAASRRAFLGEFLVDQLELAIATHT